MESQSWLRAPLHRSSGWTRWSRCGSLHSFRASLSTPYSRGRPAMDRPHSSHCTWNKMFIVCLIALWLLVQTIYIILSFKLYMNNHNIALLYNLHRVTTEEFHNNCMSVVVHWFRNRELSLIQCLKGEMLRLDVWDCCRALREKYKYTTFINCTLYFAPTRGFDTFTEKHPCTYHILLVTSYFAPTGGFETYVLKNIHNVVFYTIQCVEKWYTLYF